MPSPAWALRTHLSLDEVNVHLGALEAAGLLGIVEQDGRCTVYLATKDASLTLTGRWEVVEDRDWNAEWKTSLQPVAVGAVVVRAPWHPPTTGDADIELVIEPAQAFGTGHHETTTHCLRALQDLSLTGARVLDVGTGTGILAMAAAAFGAHRVIGLDTDPLAVEAAMANAVANALAVEVRAGSVESVTGEQFDVVVANLDTATLSTLAPALATCLARDATLIASGVSNQRADEARTALEAVGLTVRVVPGAAWALLIATAPEPG